MPETAMTMTQLNDAKKAHAASIIAAAEALVSVIEQNPDLWFGGLPPSFINLKNMMGTQTSAIQRDFGITPEE